MKKGTDCFHPIKIFSPFPQVPDAQEASSELMPKKGFTQFCNKKEGEFWQRTRDCSDEEFCCQNEICQIGLSTLTRKSEYKEDLDLH